MEPLHLKQISLKAVPEDLTGQYPFNVPVIRHLGQLKFDQPVTILVGENGTGKSSLLEALAVAVGSCAIGGESLDRDSSLVPARALAEHLRLSWGRRTHKGFFLRSEDFFNFAKKMKQEQIDLQSLAGEFGQKYSGYGRMLAMGVALGQAHELQARYGKNLDANSHGESFLKLFGSRLQKDGLYILDEPEAPLSPIRQISLIAMIKDCVEQGSQFVIATHSPILMAYPGASILSLDANGFSSLPFQDLEHVKITKAFLNNPDSFLRHL